MVYILWWIFLRLMLLNEWILNILLINVIKRAEENITRWSWLKKNRSSELSFSFKTPFHLSWRNKKFKYLMSKKLQDPVAVESNRNIPSAPHTKFHTIPVIGMAEDRLFFDLPSQRHGDRNTSSNKIQHPSKSVRSFPLI